MEKVMIIYNPSSGKQIYNEKINKIANILLDNGYIVGKFITEKEYDACEKTISCCKEDWDIIIACGGDGTLNEVANGIIRGGRKIPVAILGTGTVNDFARSLNIPKEPKAFCDMIIKGTTMDIDLGKANNKYFVNVSAFGLLSSVAHETKKESKAILGRIAYFIEGIKVLPKEITNPIEVSIESKEFNTEEKIQMFIISNGNSVGGFKNFMPKAKFDDGYLDCLIIKETSIDSVVSILNAFSRSEHINCKEIEYFQTKKITVLSDSEAVVDVDGEKGGTLPMDYEVIEKGMKIFVRKYPY
ncbi:YegS/Rv2252/BmrU family lipid kinase [Serpentinicella sp. ANB-PHB4]|uniref:diacylglycerol/lipid kinase family protein n=1 Tax=Serpentinicella sp. ANB-PHB4 TaxID=3074076 RepID=UPI002865E873|nr:YegS/Rv2252/BmrU family lipid kinase [Serpentinicella sp. ANB-PHB4]MDR5658982.1 YegS/Rv2252/BmrU family lipid kinase [Serpentinicella sp. ANB-PHB4]